jgi:hypothetical protein
MNSNLTQHRGEKLLWRSNLTRGAAMVAGSGAWEPSADPFLRSAPLIQRRCRGHVRTLLLPPMLACAVGLRAREVRRGWSSVAADVGGGGGAASVGHASICSTRGRHRGRDQPRAMSVKAIAEEGGGVEEGERESGAARRVDPWGWAAGAIGLRHPRIAQRGETTAFCSRRCNSCRSLYNRCSLCIFIFGMQHRMQ